jgi:hypothetical protein
MSNKLKIGAIIMLALMMALAYIFVPEQEEINYGIFALFLAVIVVPPALSVLRDGIMSTAPVMDSDVQVVALVTTGLLSVVLWLFSYAPNEVKLGLVTALGAIILGGPVRISLAASLRGLGPPKL